MGSGGESPDPNGWGWGTPPQWGCRGQSPLAFLMTPELTIDLQAVIANWRTLAAAHGGPTAAVVKADAYGLGAEAVAPALAAAGVRHFFVAQVSEAVVLRPLLPGVMIGVLNGFAASEAGAYAAFGLTPVLGSLPEIASYQVFARRLGRELPALLHVDTGMNRLGLDAHEVASVAADASKLAGVGWRYVMTHLVSAERAEDAVNTAQLARFAEACAVLPAMGRSVANSSGIFLGPKFRSDLARPGAALYGVNPTPGRPNPVRPAVRLTAPVLQVRRIGAGESVGYNSAWVAARPTRVATVALGYADGYHRAASGRAEADFEGARVPLIGRISMDLLTFDVTDHPGIVPGCRLELIGPAVPLDEVAAWAGTNGYEVLTSLGQRAHRVLAPL
jgi:alanine racemase